VNATWICRTCEREIDESAIDDHESQGHEVKGVVVPDRLLANDPWQLGSATESARNSVHPEE
jgi:hypothetical protein